ncbi:MAG: hypothetical protein U0Q22_01780 [Acidimicrobiales bacterium]
MGILRRTMETRRWLLVVPVVLLAGVGVVGGLLLWGGSSGRPATVGEASRRLGSATSLPPEPKVLRPEQGVYLYTGTGTDALSKPARSQTEGPDMPATVTHRGDGCWTFRIDYHTNHWQSWVYCPKSGGLDEQGGSTYQKWDFGVFVNESTSTFECPSSPTIRAGEQPGDTWTQTCHSVGTDAAGASQTTGPYRYVGTETLRIGTEDVPALHFHRERTMSGSQRGTEASDVWFSASDGLPLRNERHIEVRTDTIIGETVYSEDANFELASTVPGHL